MLWIPHNFTFQWSSENGTTLWSDVLGVTPKHCWSNFTSLNLDGSKSALLLGQTMKTLSWLGSRIVFLAYNKQKGATERLPCLIKSGDAHASQPSALRGIRGSFKHSSAIQKIRFTDILKPASLPTEQQERWREWSLKQTEEKARAGYEQPIKALVPATKLS